MANGDDLKNRNEFEQQSFDTNRQLLGFHREITKNLQQQSEYLGDIVVDEAKRLEQQKKGEALTEDQLKNIEGIYMASKKRLAVQKESLKTQKESYRTLIQWRNLQSNINSFLKDYLKNLFDVDREIKSVIKDLGLTSGKAQDFRTAIEDSAVQAARLGMGTEELVKTYGAYVDQVGRVVSLNGEQMEAMAALVQGTGLVNTEAAQLAGQFELLGKDIISVNKTVEGIMETSERMGVNATKVLKAVSGDFKRLQTYTFRSGVQGMGKMAAYGEKFKIDINTALDAAEKSRRLEGAVELAAQLQVLGGEFAKSDPFEMLFLSRNDPVQFQKKIAELTKGMATLNKTADGFEYQLASPMARDLLEQAGNALGISLDKMTEMALQQKKIGDMRQQMFDAGYTKDQREAIEGLAQMDASTGKFFVNVKGFRKDIATLGSEELKYLKEQSKSLDKRAKDAQAFDEQFQIFMSELKAVGLPLLQGINHVLKEQIRPLMDKFTDFIKKFGGETKDFQAQMGKAVGYLLLAMPVLGALKNVLGLMAKAGFTKIASKIAGGTAAGAMGVKGGFKAGAGAGVKAFGKGAGIGLALAGAGVGIKMAAEGITSISESIKGLDEKQMEYLKYILIGLPAAMVGLAGLAAIPVLKEGFVIATLAAMGLGKAMQMVSNGINSITTGLATLIPVAAENKDALLDVALGIGAIQGALLLGGAGSVFSLIGAGTLALGMKAITSEADDLAKVGNAFANISTVLKGSREDYAAVRETVDAIAKADFSNLKALSNLNQLFSQPLKVEFAQQDMTMVANITMEIDGDRFVENLRLEERMGFMTRRAQNGGL